MQSRKKNSLLSCQNIIDKENMPSSTWSADCFMKERTQKLDL